MFVCGLQVIEEGLLRAEWRPHLGHGWERHGWQAGVDFGSSKCRADLPCGHESYICMVL